jgi:hypothetical protein
MHLVEMLQSSNIYQDMLVQDREYGGGRGRLFESAKRVTEGGHGGKEGRFGGFETVKHDGSARWINEREVSACRSRSI